MGGVTVAKRLERLVRFVPGVAGYQDRENARATDKQVRMRLAGEIHRLIQSLEEDKERIAASGDLSSLPASTGSRDGSSASAAPWSSRAAATRASSISTRWTVRRWPSSTRSTSGSSTR